MLQLDLPEFAHLPLLLNSKGQKLSKRFGDVSVQSYRDAGFMPEAVLNAVALLGWNPPHREDPTTLSESVGVFLRHEVLTLQDMLHQFNLDKISKSGAKFDIEKLHYFNSMHIRDKFAYVEGNTQEALRCAALWRKMLLEEMPESLHSSIKRLSDSRTIKVMDMMKVRMRFIRDIRNHAYFFTSPDYETELGQKFIRKLK